MTYHERRTPTPPTRLYPPEKLLPLSRDAQLAIEIGKKTVANDKNGCTTPVLFTSIIASSDLVCNALNECRINPSEVLERLKDHYCMDQMSAPNYEGGLSKGAFDALRAASVIAIDQQTHQVNPIHLLLGILNQNNVVEAALRDLGLNQVNITTLYALARKAAISSGAS